MTPPPPLVSPDRSLIHPLPPVWNWCLPPLRREARRQAMPSPTPRRRRLWLQWRRTWWPRRRSHRTRRSRRRRGRPRPTSARSAGESVFAYVLHHVLFAALGRDLDNDIYIFRVFFLPVSSRGAYWFQQKHSIVGLFFTVCLFVLGICLWYMFVWFCPVRRSCRGRDQ